MLENRSKGSLYREKQRNSSKTIDFKAKVSSLLERAKPEIAYAIKRDLSVMTNMPFYRDRPEVIKISLKPIELISEYVKFFIECGDREFAVKLIKRLAVNQAQTIRKAALPIGKKGEVWEHLIPAKFIVSKLIEMILNAETTHLDKLLTLYSQAGQRGITKEQDKLLKPFRASMPDGWNFQDEMLTYSLDIAS